MKTGVHGPLMSESGLVQTLFVAPGCNFSLKNLLTHYGAGLLAFSPSNTSRARNRIGGSIPGETEEWHRISALDPSRSAFAQARLRHRRGRAHGVRTTFTHSSSLFVNISYARGASSSLRRWVITKLGSISRFSIRSRSGCK
jgi:hypothetical protein